MVLQHVYRTLLSLGADLFDFFYPRLCSSCSAHLYQKEKTLCLKCIFGLPKTYFWRYDINPMDELFSGRLQNNGACAFVHFSQGGMVQEMLHRLKYEGQRQIGQTLGRLFAHELVTANRFSDATIIIPVPLHPTRQRRRGYNQSTYIAIGMAEVLGCKVDRKSIIRLRATSTQTKKSRFERSSNVVAVFACLNQNTLRGKSVILVDDVVTTGSTMEAVGRCLLQAGVSKLYLAALAIPD